MSQDLVSRYLRPGTLHLGESPPLSLYVHLPWCIAKCPYCDFNSHARDPGGLPEQRYLDALLADLEAALPQVWGRPVVSIFIGGGTPSLFSPDGIARLLADIRARLPLLPACEITLEANPGSFERERFRAFRSAGVTRLSVGVQSFDDGMLQRLGRVHDGAQARAALPAASPAMPADASRLVPISGAIMIMMLLMALSAPWVRPCSRSLAALEIRVWIDGLTANDRKLARIKAYRIMLWVVRP